MSSIRGTSGSNGALSWRSSTGTASTASSELCIETFIDASGIDMGVSAVPRFASRGDLVFGLDHIWKVNRLRS
jgi:hypothetical protein